MYTLARCFSNCASPQYATLIIFVTFQYLTVEVCIKYAIYMLVNPNSILTNLPLKFSANDAMRDSSITH